MAEQFENGESNATIREKLNGNAEEIDSLAEAITLKANTSALAAKADTSAVTTALALKADVTALTSGLATKASNTDLSAGLASKANASDVTTALAAKASTSALTSGLATKADASALAAKADTSALTSGLATKADASTVTAALAAKADSTTVTTSLAAKADKVNGVVPTAQLPEVHFSGFTGSGTQQDPYTAPAGFSQAQLEAYLKALPGWDADYIFYGDLTWREAPSGEELEKLATPNIVFGTATGDSIPVSWSSVTNGINYTLQRATSNAFNNPVLVYSGTGLSVTDLSLSPVTTYWYRLKVSASGFSASDYDVDSKTTDVQGNFTPIAPTLSADDTANTLSAAHSLGASEIVQSTNDGAYVAYAGQISVGNFVRDAGYYKFKIKSATGRNESPVVSSPAFTETALPKPATPTNGIVDDVSNTFNFTYVAGNTVITDYQYTLDAGTTPVILTTKPLVVGDIAKAAGQVGIRLKAVAGVRQASDWLFNATAFTETEPDVSVPVTSVVGDNVEYVPTYTNWYQNKSGQYGFGVSPQKLALGESGYVQMDVSLTTPSGVLLVGVNQNNEGLQPQGGTSILFQINGSEKKVQVGGKVNGSDSFVFSPSLTALTKVRIRTDGSNMMAEYFTTSWQLLATRPQVADLYVKLYFEDQQAPNQRYVKNLKGLNLVT